METHLQTSKMRATIKQSLEMRRIKIRRPKIPNNFMIKSTKRQEKLNKMTVKIIRNKKWPKKLAKIATVSPSKAK